MSPKNLHICVERLSVVLPEAPSQTRTGKLKMIQTASNIPLRMISYGSDENDVSIVVRETDKAEVLRLLDEKLLKPEYFGKAC